ncbi:MAG TPA: tRNA epoxyqueuosine(34) reductase QueG [Bacteroidota bacterium]|nr:tRNA epoxyqueuosine(34) reductase QueG [Bacteroidota bacterium]
MATLSEDIRRRAGELGFTHCGFAAADALEAERDLLEQWLARGYHAGMAWMQRDTVRRCDVREVLPGARSVVALAMNYHHPQQHGTDEHVGRISRYAWGDDYHRLIDERLRLLEEQIVRLAPDARTRRYVDTGPVLEKAWAVRAGIGWLGKNGNVLTRDYGSWVFLAVIITDLELEIDTPIADYCGSCTACIEACPTEAIVRPGVVDANRCLSYITIEHRGEFTEEQRSLDFQAWLYGCDTCQDVCPWNSFAQPSPEAGFAPRPENIAPRLDEAARIGDEEFRARFAGSAVKRCKPEGFRRNARTLLAARESNES